MEAATVMMKNIKKLIMLLSMILMNQLTRVLTNKHGFLLYPIIIGVWMEVKTVMKKNIKQLSLLWKIIVMHDFIRPPIKSTLVCSI